MADGISELTSSIIKLLKEAPSSISDISAKLNINWRTAQSYLELLKSLGLTKEQTIKNKRVFFYLDKDNYFSLPIKPKDKTVISTIYALIKKFCNEKFNKEPTKTQVYKIIWKINQKLNLNLPIGWYKYGPLSLQAYKGDEKEETKLSYEKDIKEITEKYCLLDNIQLQNMIYKEEDKKLYLIKQEILEKANTINKEELSMLLMELIKYAPEETTDVTTDYARVMLLLGPKTMMQYFDLFWEYVAMIMLKNSIKDHYDTELYMREKIETAKKDIEILLDDVVRTYMDAKYSQDKLYQKWIQKKK